jgi:hypothetical protein
MNTTISLSVSLIFGLIIILVVGGALVAFLLRAAQPLPLRKPTEPPEHDRALTMTNPLYLRDRR